MSRRLHVLVLLLVLATTGIVVLGTFASGVRGDGVDGAGEAEAGAPSYTGSRSCRACHEHFYELWAPSHHGTAMQPYTPRLAAARLTPQAEDVVIGKVAWRYEADEKGGWVHSTGPGGEHRYPIAQVMGGKNVFFFLTPLERGRLQVLPVAYDLNTRGWYDTTASMVRHAGGFPDEPVEWTDPLLTFNTSCWSCHVSQLSLNYDPETQTYASTWAEPGINCETCHGPGEAHIEACRKAPEGKPPEDLELFVLSTASPDQRTDTCSSCHAKATPLTASYEPGAPFFDHFDLVTLENPDFHPDGRDLGENYTLTLWRISACAKSKQLDCVTCHTSSGRYRFRGDEAQENAACLPCHAERVANAPAHTHHPAGSPGNRCIACHMPMTEFARMKRTDHSMRPPAPALTLAYGSPNACNLCHDDHDAAWADAQVRAWHPDDDYQAPLERRADLVAAARRGDWTDLDAMLAEIASETRDEILATSLLRLLRPCPDPRTTPAFVRALADPSPLVRGAAASGLGGRLTAETLPPLLEATGDPSRLVRIRAAGTLAPLPFGPLPDEVRKRLQAALGELRASLGARPDTWTSHYNLGNFFRMRGDLLRARAEYAKASALRPAAVLPTVNAAMNEAQLGNRDRAETLLRRALVEEPENAVANFNLGLLLAEGGKKAEAVACLRRAFAADPQLDRAALNLAVLLGGKDPRQGVVWARKAARLRPDDPRAVWTLAFYERAAGEPDAARVTLERALDRGVTSAGVYGLLGRLYEGARDVDAARALYARAAGDERLAPRDRAAFARRAQGGR